MSRQLASIPITICTIDGFEAFNIPQRHALIRTHLHRSTVLCDHHRGKLHAHGWQAGLNRSHGMRPRKT